MLTRLGVLKKFFDGVAEGKYCLGRKCVECDAIGSAPSGLQRLRLCRRRVGGLGGRGTLESFTVPGIRLTNPTSSPWRKPYGCSEGQAGRD